MNPRLLHIARAYRALVNAHKGDMSSSERAEHYALSEELEAIAEWGAVSRTPTELLAVALDYGASHLDEPWTRADQETFAKVLPQMCLATPWAVDNTTPVVRRRACHTGDVLAEVTLEDHEDRQDFRVTVLQDEPVYMSEFIEALEYADKMLTERRWGLLGVVVHTRTLHVDYAPSPADPNQILEITCAGSPAILACVQDLLCQIIAAYNRPKLWTP